MKRFWMVYGLHQGQPTYRHKTEESAVAEAKRLARKYPDVEFFVLEATHHLIKRDVDVTRIQGPDARRWDEPSDDIPF